KIVASNDLDETLIASLHEQGAMIDVWGVGTKLVTCYDQPALGGVYKLGASFGEDGVRHDAIKLSEQPLKISNPGTLQVRRLTRGGKLVGDVLYDDAVGVSEPVALYNIEEPAKRPASPSFDGGFDLLQPVLVGGKLVAPPHDLESARARAAADLAALSSRTKRFLNPQPYPVGLDRHVHRRKQELVEEARKRVDADLAGKP